MNLESIYKLSVVMNMVDNISVPMASLSGNMSGAASKIRKMDSAFSAITKTGSELAGMGTMLSAAVLSPVESTFETKKALGELSSLGVKDLNTLEIAAKDFSSEWAGTTKSDFISAAYDIKSGIASLSDEGVAQFTELSGLTAKATKSSIGEMTDLFATGYGIYKDYYSDLSDMAFGEMFSAGISQSVKQFKTTGSGMAQSIKTLGASATTAQVPLEEQLSILGMLQATMSGSEAGTKYKAFLRSAVKGGEELGLKFTDTNNTLLSMPEILEKLRGKFGETMDAAEKMKLQEAFGDTEAVALIDLMYSKTGDLQNNILGLYSTMGEGQDAAVQMANAINESEPDKYERLQQQLHNVTESIGNSLLPVVNEYMGKANDMLTKADEWVQNNQELVKVIMLVVFVLGSMITVTGIALTIIGGFGLIFTRTAGMITGFIGIGRKIPSLFETMRIKALYAGDGIRTGFSNVNKFASSAVAGIKQVSSSILSFAKTAAINGANAVKSFVLGMASMAKQAIVTAVTALPGLIAGVWSFTAALLANPVTWIVIGIVALIAAIVALATHWNEVTSFIKGVWDGFINGIIDGFNWIKEKFESLPGVVQILLAAMFPIIGIPMLIITHWDSIVAFFSGLGSRVQNVFSNMIQNIKNFFAGLPEWFKESGKKVIMTFVSGITSVLSKPAEAVKEGLAKVRKLLPFSDAKEGPLSTLTLSGNRVLETVTTGINQKTDLPAEAVADSFEKIDLEDVEAENMSDNQRAIAKAKLAVTAETNKTSNDDDGVKKIIIQKLVMNVDFEKIKDIKKLLQLINEIEDYTNGNSGTSVDDVEVGLA